MNNTERKAITFEDVERRLVGEHRRPYYDWLKHVVTLALAALTSLVALQGHYVPQQPIAICLLAIGWGALVLVILAGLFALRAEYAMPLKAADNVRKMRKDYGDMGAAMMMNSNLASVRPGLSHIWSVRIMVVSLVVALAAICGFAIANLPW